jgi:hypothetical protein
MNEISGKHALRLGAFLLVPAFTFGQAAGQKPNIICDHAAPPRGLHYVCKSQCDCHLEGKLKNDEDGIASAQEPSGDLKVVTHTRSEMTGGPASLTGHVFQHEDVLYMSGGKTRRDSHAELPSGPIHEQGFIDLCDLRKAIELDPQRKEYRIVELGEDGLAKGWQQTMRQENKTPTHGGPVEVVTENIDTHESKNIFGHPAHHWITKIKKIPGQGACTTADEGEVDGWYIDYQVPPSTCSARFLAKKYPLTAKSHSVSFAAQNDCMDHFTFTGEQMNHGMPVSMKQVNRLRAKMPDGKEGEYVSSTQMEVTELSTAPIDPKVFEAPAGYSRVARLRTDGPPHSISERLREMWEQIKIALGAD